MSSMGFLNFAKYLCIFPPKFEWSVTTPKGLLNIMSHWRSTTIYLNFGDQQASPNSVDPPPPPDVRVNPLPPKLSAQKQFLFILDPEKYGGGFDAPLNNREPTQQMFLSCNSKRCKLWLGAMVEIISDHPPPFSPIPYAQVPSIGAMGSLCQLLTPLRGDWFFSEWMTGIWRTQRGKSANQ